MLKERNLKSSLINYINYIHFLKIFYILMFFFLSIYQKSSWINEYFTLLEKRLVPTNIYLNSTISSFFVFWSPPNTDFELVSEYEVNWRAFGTAVQTSGRLSKSENTYNVSNGLISGQLYKVNVISHVSLTSPTKQIPVTSPDTTVRTGMKFDITAFTA